MIKESVRLHVTGKTEYGKSFFVKNTLLPLLAKFKPVIVFDRKGEYGGPRAKDLPKAAKKWQNFGSIYGFFGWLEKNKGRLEKNVYVITCRSDQDYLRGFSFFNTLADSHLKNGIPVTLVVEEAHDLLQSKDFRKTKDILVQLARHGRHEYLGLVLISQRTKDIPTDIRSQLTGYLSFHQALSYDIEALVSDGYPEAEKLLDLKPREYLSFGEIPKHLNKIKNN